MLFLSGAIRIEIPYRMQLSLDINNFYRFAGKGWSRGGVEGDDGWLWLSCLDNRTCIRGWGVDGRRRHQVRRQHPQGKVDSWKEFWGWNILENITFWRKFALKLVLLLKICLIFKGFATSVSILVSCVASVFLFNFYPTEQFAIGTALVMASIYVYSKYPPSAKPNVHPSHSLPAYSAVPTKEPL